MSKKMHQGEKDIAMNTMALRQPPPNPRDAATASTSGQSPARNAELTTDQAADILNGSRTFLIKLLDEKKIPHRKVGSHRRVRMEDVMTYKEADDARRERILDELAAEAQEQDMGYPKP